MRSTRYSTERTRRTGRFTFEPTGSAAPGVRPTEPQNRRSAGSAATAPSAVGIREEPGIPAGPEQGSQSRGGRPHQCLGFAKFATCRREPDFGRWFEKLEADLHLLAKEPHDHHGRLLLLHDALIDLLDILDRECKRFPPKRRERIPQQRVG